MLESGQQVVQETRLYDSDRDETRSMRSKEEANDYRYFPDPDLPPLVIDAAFINSVRDSMPELPEVRRGRFIDQYALPEADVAALIADRGTADFFEAVLAEQDFAPRLAANWMLGEVFARMNKDGVTLEQVPVSPQRLAEFAAAH